MPGGRPPIKLDIDIIKRLYLEDRMSSKAISNLFSVSWATIVRRLKDAGIIVRKGYDHPVWNKGLTAENDVRVKKYAEKCNRMKGRHHTAEAKIKMGASQKGKNTWSKGRKLSASHRQKIVENNKRLWANPEFAINQLKKLRAGMKHSMTGPEVKLIKIIEQYSLPFKYTGDGSFMIGGMNPDFVNCNGKKEVIEVFGDYWHNANREKRWKRTELGRIMAFHSFGFNCKILWEHEINELPEEEIVGRLGYG